MVHRRDRQPIKMLTRNAGKGLALVSLTTQKYTQKYTFIISFFRDNEVGFVEVNGERCWSRVMLATDGTQQCGGFFKEEVFRVTGCIVTLPESQSNAPVTVRVSTDLDGTADDESFAIDNVYVTKLLQGDTRRICG